MTYLANILRESKRASHDNAESVHALFFSLARYVTIPAFQLRSYVINFDLCYSEISYSPQSGVTRSSPTTTVPVIIFPNIQIEWLLAANMASIALRLFPPVPVNTRTAHKTTFLPTGGGPDRSSPVLIRRGENVAYCIYAMHRRKDLYGDDAEEFRPERWDDKNLPLYRDKTTAAWGFLPFNGGPRVCLGQEFGLTEASYAVVRILQRFPVIKAAPVARSQEQSWLGYSSHKAEGIEKFSRERQKMTLVMSAGDGLPAIFEENKNS